MPFQSFPLVEFFFCYEKKSKNILSKGFASQQQGSFGLQKLLRMFDYFQKLRCTIFRNR